MNMNKESDILETTLAIAEKGYSEAYHFLRNAYQENSQKYGPQTLYFLACLSGGANMPEEALGWLRKAIRDNKWWYRPEVLEDDDLTDLKNDKEYLWRNYEKYKPTDWLLWTRLRKMQCQDCNAHER